MEISDIARECVDSLNKMDYHEGDLRKQECVQRAINSATEELQERIRHLEEECAVTVAENEKLIQDNDRQVSELRTEINRLKEVIKERDETILRWNNVSDKPIYQPIPKNW